MNDCDLAATEDERVELILAVAEGRLADVGAIVKHLAPWVFQA